MALFFLFRRRLARSDVYSFYFIYTGDRSLGLVIGDVVRREEDDSGIVEAAVFLECRGRPNNFIAQFCMRKDLLMDGKVWQETTLEVNLNC